MHFKALVINIRKNFNTYALLFLVLLSFLIRYPFFSIYRVHWDEWTFILMGQDIINGHLPYSNLWDIKPPLAFVAYASFISIFGKNIEGIRISGAIFVALSSFFVFLISRNLLSRSFSLLAGTLFILLVSLKELQAIFTEHLAVLPLLVALWLMTAKPRSAKSLYLTGVFLTIAIFIRLNLSFVGLFLGIYVILSKVIHRDTIGGLKDGVILSLGFFTIFIFTLIPYIINDQVNLYIQSVFIAPLSYAGAELTLIDSFLDQIVKAINMLSSQYKFLLGLSYFGAFFGLSLLLRSRHTPEKKEFTLIFLVFASAVELSILLTGRVYDHYLIQLAPFLAILCAYAVQRVRQKFPQRFKWYISLPIVISMLAYSVALNFYSAEKKQKSHKNFIKIIQYLKSEITVDDNLLITDDHIIYWLLDKEPIRPSMTHPANIKKPYLLRHIPNAKDNIISEFEAILQQEPDYILTRNNIKILSTPSEPYNLLERSEPYNLFDRTIFSQYTLRKKIGSALLFKKK